jgi:transposase
VADPHAKISAIGAMSISPHRKHFSLYFDLLDDNKNYHGDTIVPFLKRIHRKIQGPLTILWDAIPVHRAGPVTRFLRKHRATVPEFLPRYAPNMNPVDKIWFYIKFDRLPNFAPPRLSDLRVQVQAELHRLQRHPEVLKSLFQLTTLPV